MKFPFLFALMFAICTWVVSAHADFTYDEAKMSACILELRDSALEDIPTAINVRMTLIARDDGFTNFLVAYNIGNTPRLRAYWVQQSPCKAALIADSSLMSSLANFQNRYWSLINPSSCLPELGQESPEHSAIKTQISQSIYRFSESHSSIRTGLIQPLASNPDFLIRVGSYVGDDGLEYLHVGQSYGNCRSGGWHSIFSKSLRRESITGVKCGFSGAEKCRLK